MAELATLDCELSINIYPRGWDIWRGTTDQLKAERVIPTYIKWPERDESLSWSQGDLTCELRRCRPPGMKGPRKVWIDGDYWLLRRGRTATLFDGFATARSYKKQSELVRALWEKTPEGVVELNRWQDARDDEGFQTFLRLLNAQKPSRR